MKHFIIVLISSLVLFSCGKAPQKESPRIYVYIEIDKQQNPFGGSKKVEAEADTITAMNDSLAYIEAFKKYCISLKVYETMLKKGVGTYIDIPLDFKLYNDKGDPVVDVVGAEKLEKVLNDVMSIDLE